MGKPDYSHTDRDSRGRFASGNKAALGHGTRSRDNLFTFRERVTEDDIRELADLLLEKAKGGDFNAMRVILTYCLPHPAALYKVDTSRRDAENKYKNYGMNFD